jgi:beta-glucosidase/6-phospho-beta-glucosidase/beta-galactosidase
MACGSAVDWLHEQWGELTALRDDGVPVRGFTWYSLTDQIDWQHGLRVEKNDLHPVGLYDLERNLRPVGAAYGQLIASGAHHHAASAQFAHRRYA